MPYSANSDCPFLFASKNSTKSAISSSLSCGKDFIFLMRCSLIAILTISFALNSVTLLLVDFTTFGALSLAVLAKANFCPTFANPALNFGGIAVDQSVIRNIPGDYGSGTDEGISAAIVAADHGGIGTH